MDDEAAVAYLRRRRATFFFGNAGPPLPAGIAARWRLTPTDPRGWHSNMVGFVEGPPASLGAFLDLAIAWFDHYAVDTWLDVDQFSALWERQTLIDQRGFRLEDDWDTMICGRLTPAEANERITVDFAEDEEQIRTAAWVAEQTDHAEPVMRSSEAVQRRMARYWREHTQWGTRFVVATLDGHPVGAARLTDEDLPVLVGVSTIPAARRQGIGTALTTVLTSEAIRRRGACALYVERASEAARIYSRLGFRPLFRMRVWVRPHQASARS